MFVLDTDHLTLLGMSFSPEGARLQQRLEAIADEDTTTTIVTYQEQCRGWLAFVADARGEHEEVNAYRRLSRHVQIFRDLNVLEYTSDAALEFARLKRARLGVGTMDLRIAAITLANDATLLTRNVSDFGRYRDCDSRIGLSSPAA